MNISPLTRRRITQFRANRRGLWSLRIFFVLFAVCLFAEFIAKRQQAGTKRLAFVIGGFAGVSEEVKRRAHLRLSLSRMTLTHELARVILTEQVYRAFTLLTGSPYHKL